MSNDFDLFEVEDKSKNVLISLGTLVSFYFVETSLLSIWSNPMLGTILFVFALLTGLELGASIFHWFSFTDSVHLKRSFKEKVYSRLCVMFAVVAWISAVVMPTPSMSALPHCLSLYSGDMLWFSLLVSAIFGSMSFSPKTLRLYIDSSL